jgi:GNAT superfamily N-acetyltransferase
MVLDAEARPSWLDQRSAHPILPVQSQLRLQQFQVIAERIFRGSRHTVARELAAALSAGSLEHVGYLGFDSGTAAAIGRMYTNPGARFAGLYGGGTLPEHRGRGLYRALVARRVHDALAGGARYMRVDALPTSQPILERLGFYELTHAWPCVLRDRGR